MALNIPNVGSFGEAFGSGIESGNKLFKGLLEAEQFSQQHQLEQEKAQYLNRLHAAEALQAEAWAKLLNPALGGGGSSPAMPPNVPGYNPNGSNMGGMPSEYNSPEGYGNYNQTGSEQPEVTAPMIPGVQYPDEWVRKPGRLGQEVYDNPVVASKLGLWPPRVTKESNEQGEWEVTHWPSGKETIRKVGLSPAEQIKIDALKAGKTATSGEKGKYQGEAYKEASNTLMRLGEQKANLYRIANELENYPNADNVIGPINKHVSQIFGDPEDQAYLGQLLTNTGNIIMQAAGDFKGAFRQGEQALLNEMKPNASDPYYVFLGKLKAMGEMIDLTEKRMEIYADLLDEDTPPHKAIKIAQNLTGFEAVNDKYKNILKEAHNKAAVQEGRIPKFDSQEEAQNFLKRMTPKQLAEYRAQLGKKAK